MCIRDRNSTIEWHVNSKYYVPTKCQVGPKLPSNSTSGRPISVEAFMHDLKLLFVYSEVCKVHYPIHLFTFVIVGGLCSTPLGYFTEH